MGLSSLCSSDPWGVRWVYAEWRKACFLFSHLTLHRTETLTSLLLGAKNAAKQETLVPCKKTLGALKSTLQTKHTGAHLWSQHLGSGVRRNWSSRSSSTTLCVPGSPGTHTWGQTKNTGLCQEVSPPPPNEINKLIRQTWEGLFPFLPCFPSALVYPFLLCVPALWKAQPSWCHPTGQNGG